jgi:hypothetical protein
VLIPLIISWRIERLHLPSFELDCGQFSAGSIVGDDDLDCEVEIAVDCCEEPAVECFEEPSVDCVEDGLGDVMVPKVVANPT